MRKTVLLLAVMASALLVASGVAWAATIECPNRSGNLCVGTKNDDTMTGTANADDMRGRGGNDTILGRNGDDTISGNAANDVLRGGGGADTISGGNGKDRQYGGAGRDTIYTAGEFSDVVDCGPGRDWAKVDSSDQVSGCEVVVEE